MLRLCLYFALLLYACPVLALDLSKVKIISAEKLDYKDGNSVLIGNVKVQLGDYFLSAPKVFIDSDDSGKPVKARFMEDVKLESDDLNINAPRMELDLQAHLFKCFSSADRIVQTTLNDSNSKQAQISSWYQEFNYQTGFAKAQAQELSTRLDDSYGNGLEKILFIHDNLEVESKRLELDTKDNKVQYAVFLDEAIAVDDKQRTEAEQIFFFPNQDLLKAEDDVKIIYADKEAPAYVFSDLVIYEKSKNILSAFSKTNAARSRIYRADAFAKSRQIILNLDKDLQPETAILTGKAYSQIADKAIAGHELLFDIKAQSIKTLVGRPKTLLLSNKNQ